MNRNDEFEKIKITKASTNKVVTNVYYDSFGIEKVRFQNASYQDKNSIDCYVDFEDLALLAVKVNNKDYFESLKNGPKTITMGGSKSSKRFDGQPESRVMSLGRSGDKIFINMTAGKGKIGDTGLIVPDGQPDKKISVGMSIDKFRSMIIYTNNWINAYLAHYTTRLVREAEEARKNLENK